LIGTEEAEGIPVVAEFDHALSDVIKGAMTLGLAGSTFEERWVPSFDEFLEGRDIDGAVMKELLDLGHVGGEESPVRADRVST
jgi:hypothetical protein